MRYSRKLMIVLCAAALLLPLLTSRVAYAQRDAGAKARGEVGKGFWSQTKRPRPSVRGYRPYANEPTREVYRAFSYAPSTPPLASIQAGDRVTVDRDTANMMKGKAVVGNLKNGQEFTVRRVERGWLGTEIEQDGHKLNGWVWAKDVRLVTATPITSPVPATPTVPAATAAGGTPAATETPATAALPQ